MRKPLLAIVMLGGALVSLACSSDQPTPTTANATAPASTAAATVAATKSGASGTVGGAAAGALLGAKFCSEWTDVSAKTPSGAPAAAGAATAQPAADLKASIEASKASMQALADQAPAEIKPDFQVYAKFWSDYATVMAKANYSYIGAVQDPAFLTLMQGSSTSLQTASAHIQTYMLKNCTH